MRDDDDRLAVVAHAAEDGKELVRFLRGENGRRLVKDQDIGAAVQHLDDFNRLFFRNGHFVDLFPGVDVEAVAVGNFGNALHGGFQVVACTVIDAQHDVFGGGKHVHQFEVLMNHADPVIKGVARGVDQRTFAVDENFAFIRMVNPGDHVHERCFPAAVFAEDG